VTRTAPDDAGVLWVGVLEVVAAASLWGSSGVFSVSLFRMGVPPETLALFRPLFGAAGLVAWALVRRTTTDGTPDPTPDHPAPPHASTGRPCWCSWDWVAR